jgi:hypothetical protein
MSTPTEFQNEVLAMWTEPDEATRRAVMSRRFTEDVRFHDEDGVFVGHDGLERFSAGFRAHFANARFTLASPPQVVGDGFRAFWNAGPAEAPDAVSGMDFVIWDGERASVLYAFVNPPVD